MDADEALRVGLISRVLPAEGFDAAARAELERMAGLSATALAMTKQQFYQLDGLSLVEGIKLGAKVNAVARATPDFRKAIAAFLKK